MRPPVLLAVLCVLALTACGGTDDAPVGSVRVTVTAPRDGELVHDDQVQLRGTVVPRDAVVTVRGRRAAVAGGTFTAEVDLDEGVNVVDVFASAGDRRPALTALRVRRPVTVTVPDVTGMAPDAARAALRERSLQVQVHEQGDGLLDELLGGELAVCDSDPGAGERVETATTVTLTVARRC